MLDGPWLRYLTNHTDDCGFTYNCILGNMETLLFEIFIITDGYLISVERSH